MAKKKTPKPNTWMPLYLIDFLMATAHLNAEESGAYLLLIMYYWRDGGPEGGSLPADRQGLIIMAKITNPEPDKVLDKVLAYFTERDGRLYHNRIDEELREAWARYARRVAASKTANEAQYGAKKDDGGDTDTGSDSEPQADTDTHTSTEPQYTNNNKQNISKKKTADKFDYRALTDIWNEHLTPVVAKLTDTRKHALNRAMPELMKFYEVEEPTKAFYRFCMRIKASDFLTRSKTLGLDWCLKPANRIKILEGNYDNESDSGNGPSSGAGGAPDPFDSICAERTQSKGTT